MPESFYPPLHAAGFALISSSTLLIGAIVGLTCRLTHKSIAQIMAMGSGALLGVLTIDMTLEAKKQISSLNVALGLFLGAICFCTINWVVANRGARHRKRCGECVEQDTEDRVPGSGLSTAIATLIDAVPEGLTIGIAVANVEHFYAPAIVGLLLANFSESLSSTAGMLKAGRSKRYILLLWFLAIMLTIAVAIVTNLSFRNISGELMGNAEAISAGLLLAMIVETSIPEAFDHSPDFSGVLFVIGFAIFTYLIAI